MRRLLATIPHTRVIDIGCGDGGLVQTIDPRSSYTGVDISPTQLAHFKKCLPSMRTIHPGNISLVAHDVSSLPFAEKTFDLALACDVLEHVLDPVKVVRQIKRVLTPDGYALFSIPNEPIWQTVRLLSLRWPPRSPDHLYFITPDIITREFPVVAHEVFLPFSIAPLHLIHLMLVKK
jgi:SAM-dependent methyltransferase